MNKVVNITCYFFILIISALISANIFIPSLDESRNYCNFKKCPPTEHTLCKFSNDKLSDDCTDIVSIGLTYDEIQEIVSEHNRYRDLIAHGKETRGNPGPQFPAVEIPHLKWDSELAEVAQRWTNQCKFGHDICRHVDRFLVGQNAAQMWDSDPSFLTIKDLVQIWYDEVSDFNRIHAIKFQYDPSTGHYTQLVWAKTKFIGCGMIRYKDEGLHTAYLVCNYGPAGNFIDQPIYKVKHNIKTV